MLEQHGMPHPPCRATIRSDHLPRRGGSGCVASMINTSGGAVAQFCDVPPTGFEPAHTAPEAQSATPMLPGITPGHELDPPTYMLKEAMCLKRLGTWLPFDADSGVRRRTLSGVFSHEEKVGPPGSTGSACPGSIASPRAFLDTGRVR